MARPAEFSGILDVDSADEGARFIPTRDAFGVRLVFLQDVPRFMVGSKVERAGIIRHGAKLLHVMAAATVPKLTVVVRKGYGTGYYVMCGRAYEPDLIVAWPSVERSVLGAEGMGGVDEVIDPRVHAQGASRRASSSRGTTKLISLLARGASSRVDRSV